MQDKRLWGIIAVVLVLCAGALGIYFYNNVTYEYVQIVSSYESEGVNDGKYIEYSDGILEYGRNGIVMLTRKGKELWKQPSQMSNPIAEVCKEAAVVADQGGTSIYVFQKDGLKGEIQTTRPIEKVTVSAQGIVAAVLQDEENPKVMCYDAKGNILVELKTSFTNTGYPVAIALSQDGEVLAVSYLYTGGKGVSSRVVFYHFGKTGEDKDDYQIARKEYSDAIIPTAEFLDKDTILFVADQSLIIYKGLDSPKEEVTVSLDKEIRSVAHDGKHIVMILNDSGETGYELRMYHVNGKQLLSVPLEDEYSNMKISDGKILLYDESRCAIYSDTGVCKYEGTLELHVLSMFATSGLNKYMVISANGFHEIQLAK